MVSATVRAPALRATFGPMRTTFAGLRLVATVRISSRAVAAVESVKRSVTRVRLRPARRTFFSATFSPVAFSVTGGGGGGGGGAAAAWWSARSPCCGCRSRPRPRPPRRRPRRPSRPRRGAQRCPPRAPSRCPGVGGHRQTARGERQGRGGDVVAGGELEGLGRGAEQEAGEGACTVDGAERRRGIGGDRKRGVRGEVAHEDAGVLERHARAVGRDVAAASLVGVRERHAGDRGQARRAGDDVAHEHVALGVGIGRIELREASRTSPSSRRR